MTGQRDWSPNFQGAYTGQSSRWNTHCKNNHEFTEENTRWREVPSKAKGGPMNYKRVCIRCAADAQKRYKERKALVKLFNEVQAELQGAMNDD